MRTKLIVGLVTGAVLVAGALLAFSSGEDGPPATPDAPSSTDGARAPAGTRARFAYLAAQRSNRCGMPAEEIMRRRRGGTIQGSCCSPMDEHAYREQVRNLRALRHVREIPRDPYDIPVSLVKRLLRFDATISLSPRQQLTYRRAMRMSDQKAPCCCPCWRWNAFRGLSKLLIARRRWPAARLADLTDALEGCGGPAEHRHG